MSKKEEIEGLRALFDQIGEPPKILEGGHDEMTLRAAERLGLDPAAVTREQREDQKRRDFFRNYGVIGRLGEVGG